MSRQSLKSVMRLIDAAKETLPPEQDFLNDLKRSIEITDQKNRRLPSKTYKPSSLGCMRMNYYQITGVEPDLSNSSYILVGICNSGSDIHERVQGAVAGMIANGIDCENWRTRGDGIFRGNRIFRVVGGLRITWS